MSECYLKDYTEYLKSLGLNFVYQTDPEKEGTHPQFMISENHTISTRIVYFVKVVMNTGLLIIEVSMEGTFACINLYSLHQPQNQFERDPSQKNETRKLNLSMTKVSYNKK
jgi:hypothetical protein